MKREEPFIIRVTLEESDPRICDYCSAYLVNEEGIAEKECHSTDYGLICNHCLGEIEPLSSHAVGENVKKTFWYKGF